MSSENQIKKCKLTAALYKHTQGHGFTHLRKVSTLLFFCSLVHTPWDLAYVSMHFSQTHVLKNHNQWSLLLLEKVPWQPPAAQITAVGPGVNVPSTAHGSWIPADPAPPEQHMGQEATKITTHNGKKNIPNEGWILGKMSALTQITVAFMNSHS